MLTITTSPTSRDRFAQYAVMDETGRIVADQLSEGLAMEMRNRDRARDLDGLRASLSRYECLREHARNTLTTADLDAEDRAYVALIGCARKLGYRGEPMGVVAWAQALTERSAA